MQMAPEPSPASASSSTLIATPFASATKLAIHLEEAMPPAAPHADVDSALAGTPPASDNLANPLSATGPSPVPTSNPPAVAAPAAPHTPLPAPRPQPPFQTPSQSQSQATTAGLGLGILHVQLPARSISTPARRPVSVSASASATRLSERGFVEPHHSNLPRRAQTQIRARRGAGAGGGQRAETPASPTPAPALTLPLPLPEPEPAAAAPAVVPPAPLDSEPPTQPTTPHDTPNPNLHRMPTHLLSLRLPPDPTPAPSPARPSALALQQQTPLGTAGTVGLGWAGAGTPRSAAASAQLPRRRPKIARLSVSAEVARGSAGGEAGPATDVFGRVEPQTTHADNLRTQETSTGEARPPPLPAHPATAPVVPAARGTPSASSLPAPETQFAFRHTRDASLGRVRQRRRRGTAADEQRRAERRLAREAVKREREERRAKMGVQMVGAASGVEVGFLDFGLDGRWDVEKLGLGVGSEGGGGVFEDVDLGEGGDAQEQVVEDKQHQDDEGMYVLLYALSDSEDDDEDYDYDSESDSSSDDAAPLSAAAKGSQTAAPRALFKKQHAHELRLPLPSAPARFVDGESALGAEQIRAGVRFMRGVLRGDARAQAGRGGDDVGVRKRVRVLAPRGRPEDAMAVALAYLAYGAGDESDAAPALDNNEDDAEATRRPAAAGVAADLGVEDASDNVDEGGNIHAPSSPALAGTSDSAARLRAQNETPGSGIARRRGSIGVDGRMIDTGVDIIGSPSSSSSSALPLVDAASDPVFEDQIRASHRQRAYASFLHEADDAEDGGADAYRNAEDDTCGTAYTAAHRLAMQLLDEGDWLAKSVFPASAAGLASASTSTNRGASAVGVLDLAGGRRGVIGVVGRERGMRRAGREGQDEESEAVEGWEESSGSASASGMSEDGEEDEDEDGDGDGDDSAGARKDSESGHGASTDLREDKEPDDGDERRGRKISWHGLPMPARFAEASDGSVSRGHARMDELDVKPKSKSKSKSLLRTGPKAKSKSKSRVRRSHSLHHTRAAHDPDTEPTADPAAAAAARAQARAARRAARRAEARRERERKRVRTYAGIGVAWRGVLSYAGLWGVARAMRSRNGAAAVEGAQ